MSMLLEVAAVVMAASFPVLPPAAFQQQPIPARLDAYMRARERLGQFSGAVLVAQGGRVLLAKGYGYANLEHAVPNTANTKFQMASITKQFTAMAIAQLRDAGKLSLDDPICRFLADCPDAWRPVTIDQLIHHTSGIPDYEAALELGSDQYAQFMVSRESTKRILQQAREKPLDFAPGSKFSYSNTGYMLLAQIIERASGATYDAFLREHIFGPVAMRRSGILPAERFEPGLATGYSASESSPTPPAMIYAGTPLLESALYESPHAVMSGPHGDGGLYSTVEDLFKWSRALDAGTLASPATMKDIFEPKLGNYAFGWIIGRRFGALSQSHTGILPGFVSRIERIPSDSLTLIVVANVEFARTQRIARDLAAIALGKPYDVSVSHRVIARDSIAETRLTGTYILPDGTEAVVEVGPRFLELKVPGRYTAGLVPERARGYYVPFFEGTAVFEVDGSGAATGLTVHYDGIDQHAPRKGAGGGSAR